MNHQIQTHLEGLLEVDAAREGDPENGPEQGAHQEAVHDGALEDALYLSEGGRPICLCVFV